MGITSSLTEKLGLRAKTRVSYVEPVNPVLRSLFHFIRRRVSDESRLASFTRFWPCLWQACIFNGPVLGPFSTRKQAIESEVQFIETRMEQETNG